MMIQLVHNFNKAFPKYKITDVSKSASVIEHSNEDNGKFRELVLTGINGFSFCDDFASKMNSFAYNADHKGCLLKNCDAIHMFEQNGEKYLMFSELKSGYSPNDIFKAKEQLVGTYLNLMAILHVLQGFDAHDYHIFGMIAAYKPTDEILSAISKHDDKKSAFAIQLNADLKYFMPAQRCNRFYDPLNVGDFLIVYVPVEFGAQKYSVSIKDILKQI